MRTVNITRRAVWLAIVGAWLIGAVFVLLFAWEGGASKGLARNEEVLRQMEEYRAMGIRAFLDQGRVTIYGGCRTHKDHLDHLETRLDYPGSPFFHGYYDPEEKRPRFHDPKTCEKCQEKNQEYFSVGGEPEEGPYVFSYFQDVFPGHVKGSSETMNITSLEDARGVFKQMKRFPDNFRNIKVFRSYRIDPKELEGK